MGIGQTIGIIGETESRPISSSFLVGMSRSPGYNVCSFSSKAISGDDDEMMVAGDWSLAL